jgi:transposase
MWEAPVLRQRTSVGLDVHARSVIGCGFDSETGAVVERRLCPDPREVAAWIATLPAPVPVVYEAGPTGYGLARFLLTAGVDCVVAAPSKLIRPQGDRVKTDARDARHLARLLHLGEVVAVRIPSLEQEAARDLVRARDDCREDLMAARHRVTHALLRRGIVYSGGSPWTGDHDLWLRRQRFDHPAQQCTYDEALDAVLAATNRRDRLDAAITEMAAHSEFSPVITRLGCLRGISTLTAFRVGRRDRGLAPAHGPIDRQLPWVGAHRVLHRHQPTPGWDHPHRQRTCPPTIDRSRLAASQTLPARCGVASTLGCCLPGRARSRTRGQLQVASAVDTFRSAQEAARDRQCRHRARTGRLVLVTGGAR